MIKTITRMVIYGTLAVILTIMTNAILEKIGVGLEVSMNNFSFMILVLLGLPGWILLFMMELFYF